MLLQEQSLWKKNPGEGQGSFPVEVSRQGHAFELQPWQCPTCKHGRSRPVGLRGGPHQRNGQGIETQVVSCEDCSLIYCNPFPVPLEPEKLYGEPEAYFENHDLQLKIHNNQKILQELRRRIPVAKPVVLDVGCGRGELLAAAKREGIEAHGIETAPAMVQAARAQGLSAVALSSIEEWARMHPASYDGIILNAVLEHVADPDSMIRAAASLLKEEGVLYVDVPNEPNLFTFLGNSWNRLSRKSAVYNLSPTWPPFHVYGFSPRSLAKLLHKHGMAIDSLHLFSNHCGGNPASLKEALADRAIRALHQLANLTGTSANLSLWARPMASAGRKGSRHPS